MNAGICGDTKPTQLSNYCTLSIELFIINIGYIVTVMQVI